MLDIKSLEEIAQKFTSSLPPAVQEFKQEFEKQFVATVQTGLQKMNLVTREEFEIQQKTLLKTRQKLEQVEEQLRQIRQKIDNQ